MQDAPTPDLSVVIPMYREEFRIERTLRDVIRTLTVHSLSSEVVLVDDGSTDNTIDKVTQFLTETGSGRLYRVRLVKHSENRGKGAAVRTGLEAARGRWMLMMDADNAARVCEVDKLLRQAEPPTSLVAGSRAAVGADVDAKLTRKLTGLLFKGAMRSMGLQLLRDTQCGFKLYRRDLAGLIVEHAVEDGFAFDIEHLLLAKKAGARISEVGVRWRHVDGGQINPILDGLKMLARALRIRLRGYGQLQTITALPESDRILEVKPATAKVPAGPSASAADRRRVGVG